MRLGASWYTLAHRGKIIILLNIFMFKKLANYLSNVYSKPKVISIVIAPSILRYCDTLSGFLFSRLSVSITQFSKQKALIGLSLNSIFTGSLHASISKLSTGRLKFP